MQENHHHIIQISMLLLLCADHLSGAEKWRLGWAGHVGSNLDAWLTASAAQVQDLLKSKFHANAFPENFRLSRRLLDNNWFVML